MGKHIYVYMYDLHVDALDVILRNIYLLQTEAH